MRPILQETLRAECRLLFRTAQASEAKHPGAQVPVPIDPAYPISSLAPEQFLDTALAVIEDPLEIRGHQKLLDEYAETDRVAHRVSHQRAAGPRLERVLVHPETVRTTPLLVHETMRRIPNGDLRPPADGKSPDAQSVVDKRADPHLHRLPRDHLEAQPRRRDPLKVGRVGEEREHFGGLSRQP